MGIIDRLNLLVRSNLTSRREADDTDSVQSTLAQMELTLRQARARLKRVLEDERRLERDLDQSRQEEQRWEDRAVQALRRNDEDLAREALVERNKVSRRTDRIMDELRKHRSYLADLMSGLEALESKLDGMRTRRTHTDRPRRKAAPSRPSRSVPPRSSDERRWEEMQRRYSESGSAGRSNSPDDSMDSSWDESPPRQDNFSFREPTPEAPAVESAMDKLDATVSKFDQMEDKIGRLEAEVEATRELELQPYHEDDPLYDPKLAELERRFQELETRKRLGDLKKKK